MFHLKEISCIYRDDIYCESIGPCDACPYKPRRSCPTEWTAKQITIEEVLKDAEKEKTN